MRGNEEFYATSCFLQLRYPVGNRWPPLRRFKTVRSAARSPISAPPSPLAQDSLAYSRMAAGHPCRALRHWYLWLRSAAKSALPVLDGDIHLASQGAPSALRSRHGAPRCHGVPHIDAATQEDLFVAQGYVTAQDRLWQMDLYRRNANGELAEVLGSSLLRHDKAQRVFGFRKTAHRIYDNLPADDRAPTRRLCARRESLHHAAPGHAARWSSAC